MSQNVHYLGNTVDVLLENIWQEKALHIVETKEQLSGSLVMLVVFRQLLNGHSSTQIGALLILSKS